MLSQYTATNGNCDRNKAYKWLCALALTASFFLPKTALGGPNPAATDPLIVVLEPAGPSDHYAASELAKSLERITGRAHLVSAKLPEGDSPTALIAVGATAAKALDPAIDLEGLGNEGIVFKAYGKKLILTGKEPGSRGTLYAVNTFLEDVAGVRWWMPGVEHYPKAAKLTWPEDLDRRHVPRLVYREVYDELATDPVWSSRMKLNGDYHFLYQRNDIEHLKELGGYIKRAGTLHSFKYLVPGAEYFKEHPDYFALSREGRTTRQLCFTNPKTIEIAIQNSRTWAQQAIEAGLPLEEIMVSMNDGPGWCECETCYAMVKTDGSPVVHAADYPDDTAMVLDELVAYGGFTVAAPNLYFTNQIADALAKEFPNLKFRTLAYQGTQAPPTTIKPSKNVVMTYAPIGVSTATPMTEGGWRHNEQAVEQLPKWNAICDDLYFWSYTNTSSWRNLPNLHTLQPNLHWMLENGVNGWFSEVGFFRGGNIYLPQLRTYLTAKLAWDPNIDVEATTRDYLHGVFGKAGEPIGAYLKLLEDRISSGKWPLLHGSRLGPNFFTPEILDQANALFDKAEAAVGDDAELLARVRNARTELRFAKIDNWPDDRLQTEEALAAYQSEIDAFLTNLEKDSLERMRKRPGRLRMTNAHLNRWKQRITETQTLKIESNNTRIQLAPAWEHRLIEWAPSGKPNAIWVPSRLHGGLGGWSDVINIPRGKKIQTPQFEAEVDEKTVTLTGRSDGITHRRVITAKGSEQSPELELATWLRNTSSANQSRVISSLLFLNANNDRKVTATIGSKTVKLDSNQARHVLSTEDISQGILEITGLNIGSLQITIPAEKLRSVTLSLDKKEGRVNVLFSSLPKNMQPKSAFELTIVLQAQTADSQ